MLGGLSVWVIIHVSLWDGYYVWWDVISVLFLGDDTPPGNPANRFCRCIVLMLDQPPRSSPANVGRSASAGAVLTNRVRRWPNIVPHRLRSSVCCVGQHCTVNAQSVHVMHICTASLGDESILDGRSVKSNICPFINLDCCLECDSILGAYIKYKEIIC